MKTKSSFSPSHGVAVFCLAILLALALLLPSPGLAEGIPYNRKTNQITTPHTIFEMTPAQLEEAEALRTLTLTPEQWALMRKKTPGYPKRLTVVTHKYNDCSCGLSGFLAIWLPDKRIGVLNWAGQTPAEAVKYEFNQNEGLVLTMDRRGQFYLKGRLIPYPAIQQHLTEEVERRKQDENHEGNFYVSLMLPAGMTRESVTLATRVEEVATLVEAVDGNLWVN